MKHIDLIKETNFEIHDGCFENVEIKLNQNNYILCIDGIKWMNFNSVTKQEALECLIHYVIAKGHVVTTGLGLGIREQLILSKPDVTQLIVIEKSLNLIEYHKIHSSWAKNPKVKFINGNASQHTVECDVLLLDHFEQQNFINILNNVNSLSTKNQIKNIWFWPFEIYIRSHMKKYNCTLMQSYQAILNKYSLKNFPNLSEELLIKAIEVFPETLNSSQIDIFV